MATYGDDIIKWRFGFLVKIDRAKFPDIANGRAPYGFFGLFWDLAIQYDFTEIN